MPNSLVDNCVEVRGPGSPALQLAVQLTRWKLIRDGKIIARRDEILPLEVRKVALYMPELPDWTQAVSKGWLESTEGQAWLTN